MFVHGSELYTCSMIDDDNDGLHHDARWTMFSSSTLVVLVALGFLACGLLQCVLLLWSHLLC